jgi:cutinase
MKFLAVALFAVLATASPIVIPEAEAIELQARQLGLSSTELESGSSSACPKAILIFARGSTETGNLVGLNCCSP